MDKSVYVTEWPNQSMRLKSNQVIIISIALFTMQIVSKQLYSIKQGNSVFRSPLARWNLQFNSRLQQSQIVKRTHLVPVVLSRLSSSWRGIQRGSVSKAHLVVLVSNPIEYILEKPENVCQPHPTWQSMGGEEVRWRMVDNCQIQMCKACRIIPKRLEAIKVLQQSTALRVWIFKQIIYLYFCFLINLPSCHKSVFINFFAVSLWCTEWRLMWGKGEFKAV